MTMSHESPVYIHIHLCNVCLLESTGDTTYLQRGFGTQIDVKLEQAMVIEG